MGNRQSEITTMFIIEIAMLVQCSLELDNLMY